MKHSPIIVSVCIPTYKHKDWLRKCVDSVLKQETDFKFEVIVGVEFDDLESTSYLPDNFEAKNIDLRYIVSPEENLIYINNSRTGRGNFYNLLYNAKGKYIAICEGDDYWTDSSKLQKQVDFLDANIKYVACYHGCKHVDENDFVIKESRFEDYRSPSPEKLLTGQGAMITNSVMFRNVVSSFPEKFKKIPSGDTILYHLLGFHGGGKFIPDIKYSAYRIHSQGIWTKIDNLKRLTNTITTLGAIKNNLIHHFGKKSIRVSESLLAAKNNVNYYLYKSLSEKKIGIYFRMIVIILKQNSFNKLYLLKEHLIDLFKRIFKLY